MPPKQFDIIIKEADKGEVFITNKVEYVKKAEKQNHILSLNPTAKIQIKIMQCNGKNFLRKCKTDFKETPQKSGPDNLYLLPYIHSSGNTGCSKHWNHHKWDSNSMLKVML